MADHATGPRSTAEHVETEAPVTEHAAVGMPQNPFEADEIAQMEADDSHAGTVIGKLLASFFFFLFIFMMYVTWWTYDSTRHDTPPPDTVAPVVDPHVPAHD